MSKQFIVGKVYKFADGRTVSDEGLLTLPNSGQFTCTASDCLGCWSVDAAWKGNKLADGEGWCVASPSDLTTGAVVEV